MIRFLHRLRDYNVSRVETTVNEHNSNKNSLWKVLIYLYSQLTLCNNVQWRQEGDVREILKSSEIEVGIPETSRKWWSFWTRSSLFIPIPEVTRNEFCSLLCDRNVMTCFWLLSISGRRKKPLFYSLYISHIHLKQSGKQTAADVEEYLHGT
jgi:hypothetical protein